MSQSDRIRTSNILLGMMSDDDRALLDPYLTRVDLAPRQMLVARGEPVAHVYFPEGGVASIVAKMGQSGTVEAGIYGREGVSAIFLLLGSDRSPHDSFVQVDISTALRIDTDRYLDAIGRSDSLRMILLRYVQTFLVQSVQSVATNASQRVETRLARWLLMCHDRMDGDEIALTHEFMGMMISAERSGVTMTLHILEGAGMIASKRGRVIIRNREKLEELAGDSYGVPEAEYRHLIGPLGRSAARFASKGAETRTG